jgi:dihydrofolate reductase
MRKLISSINITLDGFCDHTAMIADEELHENANDFLRSVDTILFGRVTYELMKEGWPPIVKNPTGHKPIDDFAVLIDNIDKVVFSRTLKSAGWKNARLADSELSDEVLNLKQHPGKNIGVGGPTLIIELMNLDLIDEYHFNIQPIILGSGLQLFKNIADRRDLKLLESKAYVSGVLSVRYERTDRKD